jgi:hypothetical protein
MSENQSVEFKENWKDEYLKWICGFANTTDAFSFQYESCREWHNLNNRGRNPWTTATLMS